MSRERPEIPMHEFIHEHTQAIHIHALRCIICCKLFRVVSNEHKLRSKCEFAERGHAKPCTRRKHVLQSPTALYKTMLAMGGLCVRKNGTHLNQESGQQVLAFGCVSDRLTTRVAHFPQERTSGASTSEARTERSKATSGARQHQATGRVLPTPRPCAPTHKTKDV